MFVRRMLIKDIAELAVLYHQFWGEESSVKKIENQFIKLQKQNTHILLSAIEEDSLVGSVMGIFCEELYGDCRPFLVIEIVDKNFRKRGIGRALLSEMEKIAKQRGCTQIILVTESNRIDACGFY